MVRPMRDLISSLVVAVVAVVVVSAAPAAAQSCAPDDPATCASSTELQFCNDSNELETVSCPEFLPGTVCEDRPCSGTECPPDFVDCVGTRGNACLGLGKF